MMSGKRFHLMAEILGIEAVNDDNRLAVIVPSGEIVTVVSGPRPDDQRLVDILWGNRKLVMFYEDIHVAVS